MSVIVAYFHASLFDQQSLLFVTYQFYSLQAHTCWSSQPLVWPLSPGILPHLIFISLTHFLAVFLHRLLHSSVSRGIPHSPFNKAFKCNCVRCLCNWFQSTCWCLLEDEIQRKSKKSTKGKQISGYFRGLVCHADQHHECHGWWGCWCINATATETSGWSPIWNLRQAVYQVYD